MNAWFGSDGSTAIPLTKRVGVDDVSMRKKFTMAGLGLSAFEATKTRPRLSPTQSVPVSLGARLVATMNWPGALSEPKLAEDRFAPIATQSPQGEVKVPVNSLQLESKNAWLPPLSCVRQTCWSPVNSV